MHGRTLNSLTLDPAAVAFALSPLDPLGELATLDRLAVEAASNLPSRTIPPTRSGVGYSANALAGVLGAGEGRPRAGTNHTPAVSRESGTGKTGDALASPRSGPLAAERYAYVASASPIHGGDTFSNPNRSIAMSDSPVLVGGKTAMQSVTVRAALVAIVTQGLLLLKVTVDPVVIDQIAEWIFAVVTIVSTAVAIWGRIRASRRIVSPPNPGYDAPLVSLVALLVVAGGCAADAQSRWAQGRDALTTTQKTVVTGNRSGLISDADFVALDPFAQAVRAALARADELIRAGGSDTSIDYYLDLAETTLAKLAQAKGAVQRKEKSNDLRGDAGDDRGRAPRDRVRDAAGGAGRPGGHVHARAA